MKDPMGEYGGEVIRRIQLFGKQYKSGDFIEADILNKLSLRHKIAIRDSGMMRYSSVPTKETKSNVVKVSKKKVAKKKMSRTKGVK